MELNPAHPLFYLSPSAESLLDVGCNVGASLESAYYLGVEKLAGIEINPTAVQIAKAKLSHVPGCLVVQGSADALPFPSKTYAQVLCSDVLEHVPAEDRVKVIQEVHRVLKEKGNLILTVPYHGLFSALDSENMRFRLPRLYHWVSNFLGGRSRDEGFHQQKHGVVWHHHFSKAELDSLFSSLFEIQLMRWRGAFLTPFCDYILFPFYRRKKTENWFFKWVERIKQWDMRTQYGSFFAYNVLILLKKK